MAIGSKAQYATYEAFTSPTADCNCCYHLKLLLWVTQQLQPKLHTARIYSLIVIGHNSIYFLYTVKLG